MIKTRRKEIAAAKRNCKEIPTFFAGAKHLLTDVVYVALFIINAVWKPALFTRVFKHVATFSCTRYR